MIAKFHQHIHYLYFLFILTVAVGLSTSMFLMSVGSISLAVLWVLEGNYLEKFKKIISNKTVIFLLAFYLLHVIGLMYSENLEYGVKDLRIKLPLLLFPVVFASMTLLEKKWLDRLLFLFITTVLISSFYSFLIHKNIVVINRDLNDPRSISPLISHVRLSLNICLSIFIIVFHFSSLKGKHYFWRTVLIFWWLYFLYILESATGFSILIVSSFVIFAYFVVTSQKIFLRIMALIVLISIVLTVFIFIYFTISQYYQPRDLDITNLEKQTKYGEEYSHDTENLQLENGYYLWLYIAEAELSSAWNERSKIKYDQKDNKGQPIKWTIIRYLTSKGLRKDRDGVYSLSKDDIENIEGGIATISTLEKIGLSRRLKIIIYEFDSYWRGNTPNGSSVTMRFEYWKTGWHIFTNNWLIGVGTGDVADGYKKQYELDQSELLPRFRNRAHNQYLTILITFGIIGFVLFILSLIWPVIELRSNIPLIYILFFTISCVSFLSEDTLETQAGVTFFAFFNSLFLFLNNHERKN